MRFEHTIHYSLNGYTLKCMVMDRLPLMHAEWARGYLTARGIMFDSVMYVCTESIVVI